MLDQYRVLAVHPSARVVFNTDAGTFKVYCSVGDTTVALSASWPSQGEAWADAAREVEKPRPPVAVSVEVLDQR